MDRWRAMEGPWGWTVSGVGSLVVWTYRCIGPAFPHPRQRCNARQLWRVNCYLNGLRLHRLTDVITWTYRWCRLAVPEQRIASTAKAGPAIGRRCEVACECLLPGGRGATANEPCRTRRTPVTTRSPHRTTTRHAAYPLRRYPLYNRCNRLQAPNNRLHLHFLLIPGTSPCSIALSIHIASIPQHPFLLP